MFAGFTLHKKNRFGTKGRKSYLGVRVGKDNVSLPKLLMSKFPEGTIGVRYHINEKKMQIIVEPTSKDSSEDIETYYINQKEFKSGQGTTTGCVMPKSMPRGRYYVTSQPTKNSFQVEALINDPNEASYYAD